MTAVCLIGTAHNFALFARGKDGVIVDTTLGDMEVLERNPVQELLAKFNWTPAYPGAVALTAHQLAATALGSTVEVITERPTRERPYSVPKAVQATARRALAMSVRVDQLSMSTAKQLASGAPVTLAKLRQVARVLSDNNADAATRQQFWGGQAGKKWALGALTRAGLTAAADAPADPVDDAEDGESIVIPDDATQEDIDALMLDGAEPEKAEDILSSIAEDSHQFAPSVTNPDACVYCGSPPDYVIHDLPNRFAQVADQPHWFEFDPDSSDCAVCGKPVDAPIHDLTIKPSTESDTPQQGPVTASYLPSEVVDVSPVLLAAVLSAEQSDDQVKYFARMIPGRDESADAVLQQTRLGWSEWKGNTWLAITAPDYPVQLLDEMSAYTLADQLSVFPEVSVHAIDLDERALFEAARGELEAEMDLIDQHTYLAVPPDDNEVSYSVTHDYADPNTATQLYATVNELSYVWNYVDHTWDGVEPGTIDQTLASPVSFDDAMLIAHLQSKDGISPIQPDATLTDADTAGSELEDTGFFNLFAGTLLNVPDDFDAVDLDVIEDDPDDAEFDDGAVDVNDLSEPLFAFEIDPENPSQISALHVQLPDDTWMVWNPAAVTWAPGTQPEDCALVDARKAADYAAYAYDQEHGGTISSPGQEGELLTAMQGTEFANGFSKIFTLAPPQQDAQPPIYFDEEPVRAAGGPTPDSVTTDAGKDDDGYTAEERSKNASKQVRDKFGRFATAQARVALPNNNGKGTIRKIDPERQTVEVAGDDGKVYDIPADQVQVLDEPVPQKINFDAIEAQPRATERTPKAFLPYTLPPMNAEALKSVVNGYQKFIDAERAAEDQKRKAKEKLGRAAEEPIK